MLNKTCLSVVLLLSAAGIARAQDNLPRADVTTEAMIAVCTQRSDPEAQAFCFGFGEGVYQAYVSNRQPHAPNRICPPKEPVSRRQVLDDFLAWAKINPQHDEDLAASTLQRYLFMRFPCRQ